jgi:hypothetical protein
MNLNEQNKNKNKKLWAQTKCIVVWDNSRRRLSSHSQEKVEKKRSIGECMKERKAVHGKHGTYSRP